LNASAIFIFPLSLLPDGDSLKIAGALAFVDVLSVVAPNFNNSTIV